MDYTQYSLGGENVGGKGRLVLAVMTAFRLANNELSVDEMRGIWAMGRLITNLDEVERKIGMGYKARHFMNATMQDVNGVSFVISDQWGAGPRFDGFLYKARSFGFVILPVGE